MNAKAILVLSALTLTTPELLATDRHRHHSNPLGGHAEGSGFTPPHATNPRQEYRNPQANSIYHDNLIDYQMLRAQPLVSPEVTGYVGVSAESIRVLLETGELPFRGNSYVGRDEPNLNPIRYSEQIARFRARDEGFLAELGLDPFVSENKRKAAIIMGGFESRGTLDHLGTIPFSDQFSKEEIMNAALAAAGKEGFVIALRNPPSVSPDEYGQIEISDIVSIKPAFSLEE